MAGATPEIQCFLCKKDTRLFNCKGCSQNFCLSCLTKHDQELSQRLDAVETDHEQFRQTILQEMKNLKNSPLIQEINRWEEDSIAKIKQTGEQSRQMIINYRSKTFNEMESKLNKLTAEMKQSREKNKFNEMDINQFTEQLKSLKDELEQPSDISVERELTSLINKIVVTLPSTEGNESITILDMATTIPNVSNHSTPLQEPKLSKKQKRRRNQKQRQANNETQALVPSEALTQAASTLNLDPLRRKPRKSLKIIGVRKMASNNEYFLVCPKNQLVLFDAEGKEHLNIDRDFEVEDICWSTYLKRFLILSEKDLYSLDLSKENPLTNEISQFTCGMDECTCYENIFMMISDYGGATIEVWDMRLNWKSMESYKQPISCRPREGICSIRFSSSGTYLGVTLTAPWVEKAYFQLRTWQNMTVLSVFKLPFYEGHCNHYLLALPNDEFLVHKYSEKEIFHFDCNGQPKQMISHAKGVCSVALLTNDKNCLAVQTRRPDELSFYDL